MTEPAASPSDPGTVVLNLGRGTGALVIYTPADLDGAEVEISRDDNTDARRTHSQVRQRQLPGQTRYAAVYPDLAAGRYTIWHDQRTPAAAVTVAGGEVTSYRWPD
jgi:hypothetical protein